MAATESCMTALKTPLPRFDLPDTTSGRRVRSGDFAGRPVLVMFICNHCPFVVHVRGELAKLGKDYASKLAIVAISSNDVGTHPQDGPEHMAKEAKNAGYTFPYCFDETQEVARQFQAACTPDFFLYDAAHKLAYRGQLDDSRPKNTLPVDGKHLRAAIDAVLAGRSANTEQKPSIGCNIKWKAMA
ncbi:MAG: thioredoxin family protein [Planctomycetes bacterium]|nr:thioredoxin family protein [Planctomycetota bacterium]